MSALDVFPEFGDEFTHYAVELQIRDLMVGGVPSDKSVIRKWLEARMDLDDTALQEVLDETIADRNGPLTVTEKVDALAASPTAPSSNGFKRDPDTGELVYEARCMKAALKEWINSAYPGVEWPGKTDVSKGFRKGAMATAAERIFVPSDIGLGVKEPSRQEERIKRVMTPQGPRSSINVVDVVDRPLLVFTLAVRDDFLPRKAWARIWQTGEEIGIGADRARSDGRFDLLRFDKIS